MQGTQSQCGVTAQSSGMGREGEGGLRRGGDVHTYGWFMVTYGRNHHNIVIILQLKLNKIKKKILKQVKKSTKSLKPTLYLSEKLNISL